LRHVSISCEHGGVATKHANADDSGAAAGRSNSAEGHAP
jgi:hypothetical protein